MFLACVLCFVLTFGVSRLSTVVIYGCDPFQTFVPRSSLTGGPSWTILLELRQHMKCWESKIRLLNDLLSIVFYVSDTFVLSISTKLLSCFSLKASSGKLSMTTSSLSSWNSTGDLYMIVSIFPILAEDFLGGKSYLFTFGQLNCFVRKLCYRSFLHKHVPKDTDWTQLPVLRTAELRQLSSRDFLTRLRLKLDTATSKIKRDYSDQEGPIPNLPQLVEETKEKFVAKARKHIVFPLEKFLGHVSLNADIVRGMACFDPHILLNLPLEQASFCFVARYRSFSVRGWLDGSTEDDCRDEYLEFLGHFRQIYSCLKISSGGFTDMVDTLSPMP